MTHFLFKMRVTDGAASSRRVGRAVAKPTIIFFLRLEMVGFHFVPTNPVLALRHAVNFRCDDRMEIILFMMTTPRNSVVSGNPLRSTPETTKKLVLITIPISPAPEK